MVDDGQGIKDPKYQVIPGSLLTEKVIQEWKSQIEKPELSVYIAGPVSHGQPQSQIDLSNPVVVERLEKALSVGSSIISHGLWPYIPHLTIAWNHYQPHAQEYWLELDRFWLSRCDALLRLPGDSDGADAEVAEAERLALPIFHNERTLYEWAASVS